MTESFSYDPFDNENLRFRRGRREAMLDCTVDYRILIAQYKWLERIQESIPNAKDIRFRGPGIERIVSIEGRDYMTFAEVLHSFDLYTDAMFRFTYYPLDMTSLDHMICALIETFCEKDLSSANYYKYFSQTFVLQQANTQSIHIY